MKEPRLTVELVPRTCWYSNVRSEVSAADWEKCKRFVRERSGSQCEICGGRGRKWPVECHETWTYCHDTLVQTLTGLIALCPDCHSVKHIGRAEAVGRLPQAMKHLATVNGWTMSETQTYLEYAFAVWDARSQVDWDLDISFLHSLGIEARLPR